VEFPHIQQMYEELRPQGFEVITIVSPPRDSMELMLNENKTFLPVAMEEKGYQDTTSLQATWKVGVKVWYVIDGDRRIKYAGNYNPTKIRAALKELGGDWKRKSKEFALNAP
jgi:hypothetical protein